MSIHNVLCLFRLHGGFFGSRLLLVFFLWKLVGAGAMTAHIEVIRSEPYVTPTMRTVYAHNFCALMHSLFVCVYLVNARYAHEICARARASTEEKTGQISRLCCRATRTTSDGYCLSDQFETWQLINRALRRKNSLFNNV